MYIQYTAQKEAETKPNPNNYNQHSPKTSISRNIENNQPNTQIDGLGCLALWLRMLNKPFNDRVNVGRVLAWDHIAAYFSIGDRFQPPEHSNKTAT